MLFCHHCESAACSSQHQSVSSLYIRLYCTQCPVLTPPHFRALIYCEIRSLSRSIKTPPLGEIYIRVGGRIGTTNYSFFHHYKTDGGLRNVSLTIAGSNLKSILLNPDKKYNTRTFQYKFFIFLLQTLGKAGWYYMYHKLYFGDIKKRYIRSDLRLYYINTHHMT